MVITEDTFQGGSRLGKPTATLEKPIYHLKNLGPLLQTPSLQGSLVSAQLPSEEGRGKWNQPSWWSWRGGGPSLQPGFTMAATITLVRGRTLRLDCVLFTEWQLAAWQRVPGVRHLKHHSEHYWSPTSCLYNIGQAFCPLHGMAPDSATCCVL